MDVINIIGALASLVGCGISIYLFCFTKKLPSVLEDYSLNIQYNEERLEMKNQFEADIKLLTNDNGIIDDRLIAKLCDDLYHLKIFKSLLDKDCIKTINETFEMLDLKDEIDKNKLIRNITALKACCQSSIRKGFFIHG